MAPVSLDGPLVVLTLLASIPAYSPSAAWSFRPPPTTTAPLRAQALKEGGLGTISGAQTPESC